MCLHLLISLWCRAHSTHCLGAQGGRAAEDGAQKRKRGDDFETPDLIAKDEVSDDEDDATGRRRGMPGGRVDGRRTPISRVTVCSALARALASTCKNVWNCPDSALLLRILQEPCRVPCAESMRDQVALACKGLCDATTIEEMLETMLVPGRFSCHDPLPCMQCYPTSAS